MGTDLYTPASRLSLPPLTSTGPHCGPLTLPLPSPTKGEGMLGLKRRPPRPTVFEIPIWNLKELDYSFACPKFRGPSYVFQ